MNKNRHHDLYAGSPVITRRQFVCRAAWCGAALALPVMTSATRVCAAAAPAATVAAVTGERAAATRKALELIGGIERIVKKNSRVVLKPNMSFPHPPERATNTHPDVVATVARLCREAGAAEVLVLDYPFNRPEPCLKLSGIRDACSGIAHVRVLAVSDERFFREIPVSRGRALRNVKVMQDVLDADVLINLPTAKSHSTTGVSLGMKNLMGIIWDRRYFHARVDIDQAIADLSTAVKVDLIVLDASRALVTAGPSGPGIVEYPGMIIAGHDPVAVDAVGVTVAQWYGQEFTGLQVKHIAAAARMNLGTADMQAIRMLKAAA
jgi:uncharacterized protein (DUF362 family)